MSPSRITVENPEEVNTILGLELQEFVVLDGEDAYCSKNGEILMYFSNRKEMRIYIDHTGNLCVYTD